MKSAVQVALTRDNRAGWRGGLCPIVVRNAHELHPDILTEVFSGSEILPVALKLSELIACEHWHSGLKHRTRILKSAAFNRKAMPFFSVSSPKDYL